MKTPHRCSKRVQDLYEGESVESATSSLSSDNVRKHNEGCKTRHTDDSSASCNTDADLINQNKSNKQNERISKPCKDGFCYCFTSDTDDIGMRKTEDKRKSRRSTTHDQQVPEAPTAAHEKTRKSHPPHSKGRHNIRQSSPRKLTAISKLEDSSQNLKAPILHIVQEIHQNYVLSEVHVNRRKLYSKTLAPKQTTATVQKIIKEPIKLPKNPQPVTSDKEHSNREHQKVPHTKEQNKRGGRLLQKRLSNTRIECKPRNPSTPPPKPPRSTSGTNSDASSYSATPSIREAEQILDDFLRSRGIPIPKINSPFKKVRRSYPLSKNVASGLQKTSTSQKPRPSCPSLSDIQSVGSVNTFKSKASALLNTPNWEAPRIREMLNVDEKQHNFQTNNSECGPQVGWVIPPKIDIDTVDGADHNLAENMESKSTPVKGEVLNNKTESQKFILAEQFKDLVSKSPWSTKKAKDKHNLKKSRSLLNTSKNKLMKFITKKSPNRSGSGSRSIGVQTSTQSSSTNHEDQSASPQSPPGSYLSNTPARNSKLSQTDFDFTRTVQSPKREKPSSRKLLFPSSNISDKKTSAKRNPTYQSFTADLENDLTQNRMGQVLNSIRRRLEASDDYAVGTFNEIKCKEAAVSAGYDCIDGCEYQVVYHVAAQADVHNEPDYSYSEVEEHRLYVAGSPVVENTNAIEHFVAQNDPNAIYAVVSRARKKGKPTYNNALEQDSPPKFRATSKTDLSVYSEIFQENLTSDINASPNRLNEVTNQEELLTEANRKDVTRLDNTYESLGILKDCFNECDEVSYEIANDGETNRINPDSLTGKQSTPKKIYISKHCLDNECEDDIFHQTESCPATPGWLLNEEQHSSLLDESLSFHGESELGFGKTIPSTLGKYRTLKDKLRKSFRRSKDFLKNEKKRISDTLYYPKTRNLNESNEPWDGSSLCITDLFAMDEKVPVKERLTQAVNICRQIPQLETSPEMVEAERLLLVSTIKKNADLPHNSSLLRNRPLYGSIKLTSLQFPIKNIEEQLVYFNYHYISVFSSGGQVKSTQSAECRHNEAAFRECNVVLTNITPASEINCDIYMLRLKRVSTVRSPSNLKKRPSLTSASSEEILSRFRPYASFVMKPSDFVPYHLNDKTSSPNEDYFSISADNHHKFTAIPRARNTNSLSHVNVYSEVNLFFKKFNMNGFLNLQDLGKLHNWNLRWCEIDCLELLVWNSPNDVDINQPIHRLDMVRCSSFPIECAAKEICARPRSFSMEIGSVEQGERYNFSADNKNDLDNWISALNEVLEFIATWMK